MPSTRDLRRRINSVQNTAQITKAMEMVAASKMRKAQQSALAGRPYASLLNGIVSEVTTAGGDYHNHPVFIAREVRNRALVVVSTDKGLCGALNSNLIREALKADKDHTLYIAAGKKASHLIARAKRRLVAEFTYKDAPLFSEACAICQCVRDLFRTEQVDRVDILYTRFISTLTQKAEVRPLLPLVELKPLAAGIGAEPAPKATLDGPVEFLFEPSVLDVLSELLPHYLNFQVYQILLEAKASEQSARMVAMKNATDNARSLIKDLTLDYNKLRQSNITKELLEIATAQMAVS